MSDNGRSIAGRIASRLPLTPGLPKRKRPLSVRTKLAVATSIVFTATISVVVMVTIFVQRHQLKQEHYRELELVASNLRGGVLNMMLRGQPTGLSDLLAAYGKHGSRASAEILDGDMLVVASSQPGREGQLVPVTHKDIFHGPYTTERRVQDTAVTTRVEPMLNQGACQQCHDPSQDVIGYLVVSLSQRPLEAMMRDLRNILLHSSGATLVLLLIITSIALSALVVHPLRDLRRVMRRAEAGDLTVRASEQGISEEFEVLAEGFNSMLDRLVAARTELVASYKERLLQADRFVTVGELASGLAHEIKNPLAGLSGAVQILIAEYEGESGEDVDEKREVLEEMQHQIDRLDRAMQHLLRFARPKPPDLKLSRVNGTIERVLSLVSKYKNADRVAITADLTSGSPILADALQLEQVLLNLCLNAVQAMPDGGTLHVSSHDDGDELVVEVIDSGPGIPEKVRADIFKPFFTTKTAGTGLGLPISRRIVREHHGEIEVTCPETGGTRFTMRFPRGMESGAEPAAEAPQLEERPT